MDVIGAGLSRTGTMSTRAALERLGYPCYHMTETPLVIGHLDAWLSYAAEQSVADWETLFENYKASVDLPGCLFYRQMLDVFPTAKVLLNLRDHDKWYDSLIRLSLTLEEFRPFVPDSAALEKFLRLSDILGGILTGGDFSRENCIRSFEVHNAVVQKVVPEDRLLVFRVQDGWEPLCRFLGQDIPDEPFPHLNEGSETIRAFMTETFAIDI